MASIREQILGLENPNPSFDDPEYDEASLTAAKLSRSTTEAQVVRGDRYDSDTFGSLRKKTSTLLEYDKKYQGVKISRDEIQPEDVDEDDEISGNEKSLQSEKEEQGQGFEEPSSSDDDGEGGLLINDVDVASDSSRDEGMLDAIMVLHLYRLQALFSDYLVYLF
eukprot:Seg1358.4 transcript_id=Seg1358.4/GoldUCD/mRNA.D3Y31 product="hypothetical protein" protein_id=Seg1358.4/GoldUCD/D3Y31